MASVEWGGGTAVSHHRHGQGEAPLALCPWELDPSAALGQAPAAPGTGLTHPFSHCPLPASLGPGVTVGDIVTQRPPPLQGLRDAAAEAGGRGGVRVEHLVQGGPGRPLLGSARGTQGCGHLWRLG